uniref:Transporter n=1 Tax=Eptatretus burgeri TaxID=7764 RepID=A0A8C4NE20_EPTBU
MRFHFSRNFKDFQALCEACNQTTFVNMDVAVTTEEGQVKRPQSGNRRSLPRESWTNNVEFLLATIGSVVGLGNIWRFPYLCYQNGGGAFLVPYVLMLLLCGIASLYMEMAVGQYSRRGPYHMLSQFCPLFKGLGLVVITVSSISNAYYIIIVVWSMFYLFKSFHSPFPWQNQAISSYNESFYANESTSVVYFTALFPNCLLLVLLINKCLLPGAWEGISYFIVPRWLKLLNVEVWIEAAVQILSSLGIGAGVIISFSSYNDFNENASVWNVLIVVLVNTITSIFSGFVIFSGLGYLSHVYNKPMENIAVDGPGLVFMIYPEVLSTMPLASVWAVSFFFMLFCLEMWRTISTFVMDSCGPYLLQKLHRKEFVVLLICFIQMIMGILYTTQVCSTKRLCDDVKEMTGKKPGLFRFEILTYFPGFLQVIILSKIILYKPVHYGEYTYPLWASVVLGWLINIFILIWIPLGMVHTLTRTTGTFWQVINSKMNETRKNLLAVSIFRHHPKQNNI